MFDNYVAHSAERCPSELNLNLRLPAVSGDQLPIGSRSGLTGGWTVCYGASVFWGSSRR